MTRKTTGAEREERRTKVADMYLTGRSQQDIARELGINQATVSRDISYMIDVWVEKYTDTIDRLKARELEKVNALELEYWKQYRLSQQPKKTTTEKQGIRDAGTGKGKIAEKTTRTEEREGNPAWLQRVEWCIEKRCKILGIEAATKHSVQSVQVDLSQFTPAMLQRVASGESPIDVVMDTYTKDK